MSEQKNGFRLPFGLDCFQAFVLLLLAVLLASAFIHFFLDHILSWVESHPGLASWVQAIGSLLAIITAMGGVWWQHRSGKEAHLHQIKENNILMAEICLEMCNAVLSVIRDTEIKPKKYASLAEGLIAQSMAKELPIENPNSVERVLDLQETMRLLLSKNLPIELMKSIFSLQKLLVQYKEYLLGRKVGDTSSKDMYGPLMSKTQYKLKESTRIIAAVNGIIKNIAQYKDNQ